MSSTNKTLHYNLPQFIGSDIPTWLGDFNSAMTAIDSGINAAATSASGAATKAEQALEAVNRCPFPIGYGGFFQIDPNTLYKSTTWEQKKNVFILAAGETYPAGRTGGEAQHKLTQEEIPDYKIGDIPGAVPGAHDKWNNRGVKGAVLGPTSDSKPGVYNKDDLLTKKSGDQYGYSICTYGGGQPHNNMPPYYSMPFWIRTA